MALMDEFKEERARLKDASFKDKLKYFRYYYKVHFIITLVCLVILGFAICNRMDQKDSVFYAAFVNAGELSTSAEFEQMTAQALNIDTAEYDLTFDTAAYVNPNSMETDNTTFYSLQKISILLMSCDADITIMPDYIHRSYAYNMIYDDLRNILSPEQIEKYEPYFYYMDYAIYEEMGELQSEGKVYEGDFPDPSQPEKMEKPIPVGIYINDAALLNRYYMLDEISVLGIPSGIEHRDSSLAFLDFVFSENEF